MPEILAPNVKELSDRLVKSDERFVQFEQKFDKMMDRMARTPAGGQPDPRQVFGAPHVRYGEDPLSSRGFSLMKMFGLITGAVEEEEAKVERDVHNRLHNIYCKSADAGSRYSYGGRPGDRSFLAPLATSFMQDSMVPHDFRREMKSLMAAGCDGSYDPVDEQQWIRRKLLQQAGYGSKALSWLNELTGGSLVAPPEQGELIELLRNKEALVNAGARTVPLPPQGRMKYPRQTSASNTFWVGENAPITESSIGTGEVTLQAKKLTVFLKAPNELLRFASPAAEALMRDDMTKSLALGLDLAALEGLGGDNRPLGIIQRAAINRIDSSKTTANGDFVRAEDIYRMIAVCEESNAEFEGFLMRPKTLYKYYQLRFDAVSQGDAQGGFLFSLIREAGDGIKPMLAGYPVTKSTQVSQVRSKGSASNLTYVLAGMFSEILIGMFGAIEFSSTNSGDSSFLNDQTWVKGILSADVAVRHEAALALLDNLDTTLVG